MDNAEIRDDLVAAARAALEEIPPYEWGAVLRLNQREQELLAVEAAESIRRLDDDCPGEGKCHGSVKWCAYCGEVDDVCDFEECDTHWFVHNPEADYDPEDPP